MKINPQEIQSLIDAVQASRKYRYLNLPEAFLNDLIVNEAKLGLSKREIKENFRKKLHEVIAPYLEDIDYQVETDRLINGTLGKLSPIELKDYALSIMQKHASSRERLPHLEHFYECIWSHIGYPSSILDLACALDPLALPWFNHSTLKTFIAVDIHKPRLTYLKTFFEHYFPFAKILHQDFIVQPITQSVDCVFLFKEVHRIEKRKPGLTRQICQQLNSKHIVISLPSSDLRGHHSLKDYHDQLILQTIEGLGYDIEKDQVENELLYFIGKP